jgi:RND family efflux transporter MFP subunit
MKRFALLPLLLLLVACGGEETAEPADIVRTVLTVEPRSASFHGARMSGTVRARFETPVAFQVAGRILTRHVDAGQTVTAGQLLFELDPRDFEQQVRVAEADLDAARAELATTAAETRRNRELLQRSFISAQVFERVELAERGARERVDALQARLEQAELTRGYARLEAGADGVLIEVGGEPGQVVAAGEPVAMMAEGGMPEIQVDLPERIGVPTSGVVLTGSEPPLRLQLREVAGAADPVTRTWQARYSLVDPPVVPRLGSVVKVALDIDGGQLLEVPIGAINERGQGPQLWLVENGQVQPMPVVLVAIDTEMAQILADLPPEARVVAVGTHLLEPGMRVRDQR